MNVRRWRAVRYLLPLALLALALAFPRLFETGRTAGPTPGGVEQRTGAKPRPDAKPRPGAAPGASATSSAGDRAISEAFRQERSGVWVESSGTVERLLDDDRKGSRHQRFLLRLDDGLTLLFAHNIDLAPRAPVRPGDRIGFRGQYEWNDRGGVIHWTHHDPRGGDGGWIEHDGKSYE